ncbi:hypothetical protein [Thalassotalea atypica]|uniref:hypothetical protein n=1 Tax=Thalassotalea atypica TaxID=2054316 RepID=UPI0025737FC7|nr:hypothetical protein [Thalassotalea atypica]
MSVVALSLTSYVLSLSGNVQDNDHQRMALTETSLLINFQELNIPFKHQNWKIIDESVCANRDRNSSDYSQCTVGAKSLFRQICTALTNKRSPYWHHQKYKTMYCDAAVNYAPLVATITYGDDTQMSAIEKECNKLILKAMVTGSKADNDRKKSACQKVK